MKRKIEDAVRLWIGNAYKRQESNERKCLLILGQRQVGKTYSVTNVIGNERTDGTKVVVSLNFEMNPEYKEIFESAIDADTVLKNINISKKYREYNLSIQKGKKITLFLDEVQSCPKAITALKFLAQQDNLIVIASGSLLGAALAKVSSFPVGYVDIMHMHPLDFEEFLWHRGYSGTSINTILEMSKKRKPLTKTMHEELLAQFRQYIVCGGMPAIVDRYAKKDIISVDQIRNEQLSLLQAYRMDITKYAERSEWGKVQECFDSIPRQLARDNKKFVFKALGSNARAATYRSSIEWLDKAGLINMCYRLKTLEDPLVTYVCDDHFKMYMADTGLLLAMLDDGTADKILSNDLLIYKGAIYENIIGQCLRSLGFPLYYYQKDSGLELDFVISLSGRITPIEVKSGENTKSKSLTTAMETFEISKGIRISTKGIGESDKIVSLPVYLLPFIERVI